MGQSSCFQEQIDCAVSGEAEALVLDFASVETEGKD